MEPCPYQIGDLVAAVGTVCGYNEHGGTIIFDEGREWHATIIKKWHDYECGWRFWARLTDEHLADAIKEGAAGSPARKGDPHLPDREALGPEICFISEFDIRHSTSNQEGPDETKETATNDEVL
jgi:hypothetical protein